MAGGGRRRRDEPRLSARHRSAARRAGPRRDAQAPRALAQSRACLSVGALTVGLKGEAITEMGELTEAGCIAFSQADAALADTQVLLRATAIRGDLRLSRVAAPAGRASRARRRRARRRSRDAPGPGGDSRVRRDDRARHDLRAGARDRRARAPGAAVDARGRCARARGEAKRAAGDLRRRRASPAPVRRRHRLVRRALPAGAAVAQHARPRRAACGTCRRHDRSRSARTTRRSTTTRKQLPFAEAEPGATGLELLLPLTLKWAQEDKSRCRRRSRASPPSRRACSDSTAGHLGPGAEADVCMFDPEACWIVERGSLAQPGQEHAVSRPRAAGQGSVYAGRRTDRPRSGRVTRPRRTRE